jgi:hypothetical protein
MSVLCCSSFWFHCGLTSVYVIELCSLGACDDLGEWRWLCNAGQLGGGSSKCVLLCFILRSNVGLCISV